MIIAPCPWSAIECLLSHLMTKDIDAYSLPGGKKMLLSLLTFKTKEHIIILGKR